MEELTGEECQASVQAQLRIVECPVCYMIPRDLAQCVKGHIVCSVCRPKLKNECPICRQKFTDQEPTVLKQILRSLPKFCKHPGCAYKLKSGDDHDSTCRYQVVNCKLCPTVLSLVDSLSHVKRAHGTIVSESDIATMPPLCQHAYWCNKFRPGLVTTYMLDQLFWTSYSYSKENLVITVTMWLTSEQVYEPSVSATVKLTDACGNLFAFTKKLSVASDSKRIFTFKLTVPESTVQSFSGNPQFQIRVIINSNNNNCSVSAPSTSSAPSAFSTPNTSAKSSKTKKRR